MANVHGKEIALMLYRFLQANGSRYKPNDKNSLLNLSQSALKKLEAITIEELITRFKTL